MNADLQKKADALKQRLSAQKSAAEADVERAIKHKETRRVLKRILLMENYQPGYMDKDQLLYAKGHLDTIMEIKGMFTVSQLRKISDEDIQ